jgi:two-component system C4-dicarboxylate transport response regulator DctD
VPQTRLSRIGQIEASSGGTLLLDEIDSMPLALQAKLLRVLEEREVQPIGSDRPRQVDLHVVATSKRPIEQAVADGEFRSDLFYRLDVVRLRVPALRQRGSDALLLFATFVEEARARFGKPMPPLTDAIRRHLKAHDWPGNVRELRNFAWQTVLGEYAGAPDITPDGTLAERVRAFEKEVIETALAAHGGRIAPVLRQLNVPRKTFYDKVARLGIDLARFRQASDMIRDR